MICTSLTVIHSTILLHNFNKCKNSGVESIRCRKEVQQLDRTSGSGKQLLCEPSEGFRFTMVLGFVFRCLYITTCIYGFFFRGLYLLFCFFCFLVSEFGSLKCHPQSFFCAWCKLGAAAASTAAEQEQQQWHGRTTNATIISQSRTATTLGMTRHNRRYAEWRNEATEN